MKRSNMSILIQGPNVPGKPKLDREIYHIIKSIQEQIPCIDKLYDITFDDIDKTKFSYTLKQKCEAKLIPSITTNDHGSHHNSINKNTDTSIGIWIKKASLIRNNKRLMLLETKLGRATELK
jgi:hypothetical protein